MVYVPAPKSPTYWNLQSGKRAAVLTFTDNGIPAQITIPWMKERYGDPTLVTGLAWGEHRFPLDAQKGIIASLIAAAAKLNLHGISEPSPAANPMIATVQAMDIVATLCPDGEDSEIFKQVELDTTGYSQDKINPQLVSLPNPPFGIGSFPMGGRKFYQLNVHPLSPAAFLSRIGVDVRTWLAAMTDQQRTAVTNLKYPMGEDVLSWKPATAAAATTAGSSVLAPKPDASGNVTSTAASPAIKEAVASVRRALPDPGKGGAPLQKLAGEVRKLLALLGSDPEGSK